MGYLLGLHEIMYVNLLIGRLPEVKVALIIVITITTIAKILAGIMPMLHYLVYFNNYIFSLLYNI